MTFSVINGNNIDVLKTFPDNHFDSVVTDPPYGISFLGKEWDSKKASESTSKMVAMQNLPSGMKLTSLADDLEFQYWMASVFAECMRVLKPGGYLLAFSAARTYHHMAMAAQMAGFEIRDQIMWIYSSGFPKSQDVGRSIQRGLGVEEFEKTVDTTKNAGFGSQDHAHVRAGEEWSTPNKEVGVAKCTSPEAKQWEGWGTALKPAHEPIVMARKPATQSIAKNVQEHGTGALNIDATRIPYDQESLNIIQKNNAQGGRNAERGLKKYKTIGEDGDLEETFTVEINEKGRFPSNVLGEIKDYEKYFYCPKVCREERHVGHEISAPLNGDTQGCYDKVTGERFASGLDKASGNRGNNHPTVKPVELMAYLCKLVTPPKGHVLDPFNGSGSTGMAAVQCGFNYTGIELDPKYCEISRKRIGTWEIGGLPTSLFELCDE